MNYLRYILILTLTALHAYSAPETLAERLLGVEGPAVSDADKRELGDILDECQSISGTLSGMPENQKAQTFFKKVDEILAERGYLFPARGLVDLLHQALRPRQVSPEQVADLVRLRPNVRRANAAMRRARDLQPMHYADCDLTALIYVSAAERLNLPVYFVEVPRHNFVRWRSSTFVMNWDTNDGCTYSDDHYAKTWGVTKVGKESLGWLSDLPEDRVLSLWWANVGNWHSRHARFSDALSCFEKAVQVEPANLDAQNALAWFLATAAQGTIRDGKRAASIAAQVVTKAPRANWLDTLAAALAETGDFKAAAASETRAIEAARDPEYGLAANESVAGLKECLDAYERGLSYRKAVETGILEDPVQSLPYDD